MSGLVKNIQISFKILENIYYSLVFYISAIYIMWLKDFDTIIIFYDELICVNKLTISG